MQEAADPSAIKIILGVFATGWGAMLSFILVGLAFRSNRLADDIKEVREKFVPEKTCDSNTERFCKAVESMTTEIAKTNSKIDTLKDDIITKVETRVGELYDHANAIDEKLTKRIDKVVGGKQ